MLGFWELQHVALPKIYGTCGPLIAAVHDKDFEWLVRHFAEGLVSRLNFYLTNAADFATPQAAIAGRCVAAALTGEA